MYRFMYHFYYRTKHGISCIVIHDSQFLRIDSALVEGGLWAEGEAARARFVIASCFYATDYPAADGTRKVKALPGQWVCIGCGQKTGRDGSFRSFIETFLRTTLQHN